MQYISRLKSGVRSVVINPGVKCQVSNGVVRVANRVDTVTVEAIYEVLTKPFIVSNERFIKFEESDLVWAVPFGMAKVIRVPLMFGDVMKMSDFVNGGEEQQIVCIKTPCVEFSRNNQLFAVAVFNVLKTVEFILPGMAQVQITDSRKQLDEKERRMRSIDYSDDFHVPFFNEEEQP